MTENIKESVRLLLAETIDYAGLFPPSELSMTEAVINYATYQNSNYRDFLGRFVLPVRRLDEFLETARDFAARDEHGWRLSVLASDDIYDTARIVEDFNHEYAPRLKADSIETKAETVSEIERVREAVPPAIQTFVEVQIGDDLAEMISALATNQLAAKIRTGGVTPEAFPTTRNIIRFIRVCLAANVPFKATAGLHHPLRCQKPLTYAADAPEGLMNGFLNLFLAAGFARVGYKPAILQEILEDEFAENFVFKENGVSWRDEHFLNTMQIRLLRERGIVSFGSCSFEEPIADLREIGVL